MTSELTALRLTVSALLILLTSAFVSTKTNSLSLATNSCHGQLRLLYILPLTRPRPVHSKLRKAPSHLLIVIGSGGHTAEMLSMLRNLDTKKYNPRTYIVSSGDHFSSSKAIEFENDLRGDQGTSAGRQDADGQSEKKSSSEEFEIITVPRARKIHQPLYTTPFSSLRCLIACIMLLIRQSKATYNSPITTSPDLILTNGPGTGVIIILASLIVRFFGLQKKGDMRSIYVESWARVKTLSLSGKILYHLGLTDRFLVQWEGLAKGRAEYRGPLV
jgi:beta-1,4-N-acetylglucosaminyltransferase